jgi:hypothetical protein
MTPQEQNDEALRRAKEEQDKLTEATLASADATDKAKAANLKMENATTMAVATLQKLLDVQLKYTIAMAKGVKGSAAFNDSVDATADVMTTAVNAIGTALAFLLPGGVLVKGLVAGFTFLTTNAIKSAAALQKAANEQGDALDKAYKSMSKSGATASDGMTGLFKDVNRMRLNVHQLDAMASTMANNAKEMTAMGGTVYKARKEYADLTANMKGFEKGMLMLGMSHEDQADAVMGYMKIQSQLTLGQQKDYGKQSAAARKYIEETEVLTRITGLNRKEQESVRDRQLSQQRSGARIEELMDEGKEGAVKLIQQQATVYAKMGPMAEQGYNDILSGHIQTEAAQKLMLATQGKVMQDQNDIIEGRVKSEREAMQATQETAGVMGDMRKSMGALYKAGQGENILLPFKEMGEAAKIKAQGLGEAVDDARREVDKLTGTVGKADAQLDRRTKMEIDQNNRMLKTQEELDNKFMDTAIGTGTFMEKLAKAFEPLTKMIGKTVAVFEPLVSGLGDMLIGAISAVVKIMTGDVIGGLKEFKAGWDSAAKGLEDTVGKWWDNFTDIWSTFGKNLLKSVEFVTGPLGPVFEKLGNAISGFTDGIKTGISKFSDMMVDMVKDLWEKLTSMIPSLGKAKEIAGNVAGSVKGAVSSAGDYLSSKFGGGTSSGTATAAPASTAPASSGASTARVASAPAGGGASAARVASAPASGGTSAPSGGVAPAGGSNDLGGKPPADKPVPQQPTGADGGVQMGQEVRIGKEIRKGGTVSWRTNNPGNISYGELAKKFGAIGPWKKLDGDAQQRSVGIAIMPTLDAGDELKMGLWRRPMYIDKTIDQGVAQWTGTTGLGSNYAKDLAKAAGASMDTVIGQLSDSQLKSMVAKQRVWEGFKPGQVIQAATGGVFDGPKSGYAATLHGNEAVIPLKGGAVPVSMSEEFNMTAVNLGELVNIMKSNADMQNQMLSVLDEIRRSQNTMVSNTGRMAAYASN